MRLIDKHVSDLTEADLKSLIDSAVAESTLVEYKEERPSWDDGGKREFVKDVASMANALGGVILYGIREKRTPDGEKTNLPEGVVGIPEADAADSVQRMEHLLRARLDPPLSGFQIKHIRLASGERCVLALGIPGSVTRPHAVLDVASPFYHRVGTSNQPMRSAELRRMFMERGVWDDEVNSFRRARMALLLGGRTGHPLSNLDRSGLLLLQVLPLGRLGTWVDLSVQHERLSQSLFSQSGREHWTLDGFLKTVDYAPAVTRYAQWFRHGGVEVAGSFAEPRPFGQEIRPSLRLVSCSICLVEWTLRAIAEISTTLDVAPPYAVCVSMVGLDNCSVDAAQSEHARFVPHFHSLRFSDSRFELPAVVLDDPISDHHALARSMRLVLDALWQAAGAPRCPMFTESDDWQGRDVNGWE